MNFRTASSFIGKRRLFIDDIFDRATLSTWTEIDAGSQITVTMINPGVQLSGSPFAHSRQIRYNTALTSLVNSWKITMVAQISATTTGFLCIGVANPANPANNWSVFADIVLITGEGSDGKVRIVSGDGTTSADSHTIRSISADTPISLAANSDYVVTLQRDYNGSGNAVYTAKAWLASSPTAISTTTWTETSASTKSQSVYSDTRPAVAQLSGTNLIKRVFLEVLA